MCGGRICVVSNEDHHSPRQRVHILVSSHRLTWFQCLCRSFVMSVLEFGSLSSGYVKNDVTLTGFRQNATNSGIDFQNF